MTLNLSNPLSMLSKAVFFRTNEIADWIDEAVSKEAASFTYVDKKSRWELKVE